MTSLEIKILNDDSSSLSSVEVSPTLSDKSRVRFVCDPDEIENNQGEEEEEEEEETPEYERIARFSFKTTQVDSFEKLEAKLNRNQCAATLVISNEVNVNGRIYVHKDCLKVPSKEEKQELKDEKKMRKLLKERLKTLIHLNNKRKDSGAVERKMVKPFGDAHLLWSRNKWQHWQTVKAHYLKQTNGYLIYEADILDLHTFVENGEIIEFVACYQNDYGLFKETNDDKCFVLERTDLVFPVDKQLDF